jgi:hypothetical protein
MNRSLVGVVIVTWNGWAATERCLVSLAADGYAALYIVLVDNGSAQAQAADFQARWPDLVAIRSPVNLGYAGGANLGIAQALAAGAEYILTLNDDTLVAPGCIAALVAAAQAKPGRDLVGPTMYYQLTLRSTHVRIEHLFDLRYACGAARSF